MGCERAVRTPLTASPRGWYGPSAPLAGEALKGQSSGEGARLKGHGVVRGRGKEDGGRGSHATLLSDRGTDIQTDGHVGIRPYSHGYRDADTRL